MKTGTFVILMFLVVGGCGESSTSPATVCTSQADLHAARDSVTYRLTAGSIISFTSPTPGPTPIIEPLMGTFDVTMHSLEGLPPNTLFALTINRFSFCSLDFAVTGTDGGISAITSDPSTAEVYLPTTINGEEVVVWGSGQVAFQLDKFPLTFTDLDLCEDVHFATTCEEIRHGAGFGYTLKLSATRN